MFAWLAACEEAPLAPSAAPEASGAAPALVAATVDTGDAIACADPGARAREGAFEEADGGVEWGNQAVTEAHDGWGLAVADFDADGFLDVFLPRDGAPQLYMGEGLILREEAFERLPDRREDVGFAAIPVDADGDGDLDVWQGNRGSDVLYRNDGGVLRAAWVSDTPWETEDGAWGDMDGDMDLDLFVANMQDPELHEDTSEGDPNELYEGAGDGKLEDVSGRLTGMAAQGWTHAAGWFDLDADLDLDLVVVNDKPDAGYTTVVRLQEDGALVDDGGALGLDVAIEGMGVGAGDLDGDLRPELLFTGWGELALMQSAPDGTWYDTAAAVGLVPAGDSVVGWGAELADLDNDGDLDAYVAFGQELELDWDVPAGEQANPDEQRDALWVNEDGAFVEQGAAWGVDALGIHRGFVLADLDRDGWLDLLERDLRTRARILHARCGEASWAGVRLVAPPPNPFAVGARVEVEAGGRRQVRWIGAGSTNVASGGPPEAHFGLGDAETVDLLRVTWPDGAVSEIADVPARAWLTVTRSG